MALNLSIKNVPEQLAAKLRARAERNHRSLQGELMAIVSEAVKEDVAPAQAPPHAGIDAGTRVGWKRSEEVYAELRRRFPVSVASGPLAVDIVRADRDSR